MRELLAMVFWVGLALPAAAQSAAVEDFQRLCVETHAEPSAVFAAADSSGWVRAPEDANLFASLSGSTEGREINQASADYRAVTASDRPVAQARERRCYLLSREPVEVTAAGLADRLNLKPTKQTERSQIWDLARIDGTLRSSRQLTLQQVMKAARTNVYVTVRATRLDGGSMLFYSELAAQ